MGGYWVCCVCCFGSRENLSPKMAVLSLGRSWVCAVRCGAVHDMQQASSSHVRDSMLQDTSKLRKKTSKTKQNKNLKKSGGLCGKFEKPKPPRESPPAFEETGKGRHASTCMVPPTEGFEPCHPVTSSNALGKKSCTHGAWWMGSEIGNMALISETHHIVFP